MSRTGRIAGMIGGVLVLAGTLSAASAPYADWRHEGSLYILTTPAAVNLPEAASVEEFPLLVRLNSETFDFRQAQPQGEDIRFSAADRPLAYEIEQWDPAHGVAGIWVRIPVIRGNACQEIKVYWGKAGAVSESSGAAVFNASNGYVTVLHLDAEHPLQDAVGTLAPTNAGTTDCAGMIGAGRRFDEGQGIFCGQNLTSFPAGAAAHSSEAWVRVDQSNAFVLGWGNEKAQGKVTMQVASPPHVRMDCYFSGANVAGSSRLPMGQWLHIVHTYREGEARVYVNGQLDGSNSGGRPLAIQSPVRMWLGGWYNRYRFVGAMDEVRISNVVRSADWVKLEYASQNPCQTLVGTLVQPGNAFAVAPAQLRVAEGESATVTAQAGGARKVYWILKREGEESIVATDRFSYAFEAGRVAGDTPCVLQFKAVYADGVKIRDIPITVEERIPDPVFTVQAPATWNGRDTIEVVPLIRNVADMQAHHAGKLHYDWTISGGAVIKEVAADRLILNRSQTSGTLTVKLTLDNGGAACSATTTLKATEPPQDPWVYRVPAKDEKPEDNQFYTRDDRNEGTLYYNGTLDQDAESVFLKVYAGRRIFRTERQPCTAGQAYAFTVKLRPGLVKYNVEFGICRNGVDIVQDTVTNLVCGDAYLIDGQSNALATDTREQAPADTNDWIRSYGSPPAHPQDGRMNLWCNPVWKARKGEKAELGYWGMELAKRLVVHEKVPICIINGAVGGTRIDQHQRSETNPMDLSTLYGRTLWRVQHARLTHGLRAILWHQGENDQGADGPTGGYGWETYQQYFIDLTAAWKRDFPNVRHYYVFQIWPNACSMGAGHGDMLREVQRTLPRQYSNLDIMSSVGIRPPGPCHYPLTGWAEFARLMEPLLQRDFYGRVFDQPITPPNLRRARFTTSEKQAIALEFDQPVVWTDSLADQFYLDGAEGKVASGAAAGNVLTLQLKEASMVRTITYLKEMSWSQDKLLLGANGLAALTFCEVPIGPAAAEQPSGSLLKADFVNPPLKFRARPLWFWNNTEVTAAAVEAQLQGNRDQSGYGGLAPLPFGKRFTPTYLSDAYFQLYGVAVAKARQLGMFLTLYDEYGFPSGSGGANMGDGVPRFKNRYPEATLKRLDKHEDRVTGPCSYAKALPAGTRMSIVAMNAATRERVDLTGRASGGEIRWSVPAGDWTVMTFVCVPDGDANVDYLDPDSVAKFIAMVYQPYYDHFGPDFGATIAGAFYDEPTLYRAHGRVWTDKFNEKFQAAYGFSPTAYYPALWYDIGPDTAAARNYLFGFRSELYAEGYMKTVQDWCTAHGPIPLLGHQDQENVKNPVGVSGDLMKCYQYQDVPGIDKIGWNNDPEGYYKIVSSVAYNWDKAQAMTETYGAMGNLSWDQIYAIVMEQYAKGINNIIPHGVWHNRDNVTYLPELSYRNPRYAAGLAEYNTYIGRLNVLLQSPGRHVADIAVLYPIATLQAGYYFDGPLGPYTGGVNVPEADYVYLGELLSTRVCRDFTFLHPEVLDERCAVAGDRLALHNRVNHEEYRVLILPGQKTIRWSNLQKVKQFYEQGGRIIATGQLPCRSAEFGHDADVVATIRALFPDVRQQILATASSEWCESGAYEAAKAIDGCPDTRWAPADESKEWWLEVNLGTPTRFNSTSIAEGLDRVRAYRIQYWSGDAWITCVTGTSLGKDKVDRFDTVTAARVRLCLDRVASATPSISEFEIHLDDGPNLAHSDSLVVHTGPRGALAIYLNSPNESNLRTALDRALPVYDVQIDGSQPLRYLHRVTDGADVYFFANIGDQTADASVRLRGTLAPECWDPHTGEFSQPPCIHTREAGEPVTRIKLLLEPVRSLFVVGRPGENPTE